MPWRYVRFVSAERDERTITFQDHQLSPVRRVGRIRKEQYDE
jgi:hypothetical protein